MRRVTLQHVPLSAICSKDRIPDPPIYRCLCAWERGRNPSTLWSIITTTKIIPAVNITSGLEGGVAAADSQGPTTDGNISDDELGDFLLDAVTWL